MILLDFEKLWKDGGYGKDNHLPNALRYLEVQAKKRLIPKEIMELAIMECFLKVAMGKPYSVKKCPCGCGIDKSGTAFVHAMLARMLAMEAERVKAFKVSLEKRFNGAIQNYMKEENKKYTDSQLKVSWIIRAGRGIVSGLKWFFVE
jgi:hypothetical protein